jgi:hypothetical protein
MKIILELNEDDMFDIICAFDAKEVLLRQNARETDMPRMKKMFLESAEKAKKNKYKWIAIRDAMFR